MSLRWWAWLWLTMVQILASQADPEPRHPNKHQNRHSHYHHNHRRLLANTARAAPRAASSELVEKRIQLGDVDDFGPSETVSVETSSVAIGTVQILPTLTGEEPHTTGIVETSLDTRQSVIPLLTQELESPTSLLQPTSSDSSQPPSMSDLPKLGAPSHDIFDEPIGTKAPPSNLKIENDHPVPRKGVASDGPIHTNKFYANFYLGDQTAPTYTHPYSLHWAAGKGPTASYGLAVSHIEADQRVYGGEQASSGGAVAWYINPVGIQSLVLGARELGKDTILSLDGMTAFAAHVRLRTDAKSTPAISFPLVQGMGFVTALYDGTTPIIQTGVYFKTVTRVTKDPKADVAKFKFVLEDGRTWLLYARKTKGEQLDLQVVNNGYAEAQNPFHGSIQVSKDPGDCETVLDEAAGIYATGLKLTGTAAAIKGTYSFEFEQAGHSDGKLLMFALPHHVESFDSSTKDSMSKIRLQTTTKGMATGVLCNKWTMVENQLPVQMNFNPYHPDKGPMSKLSDSAKKVIQIIAKKEVSQNMTEQAVLDSMYYSGKALGKFALVLYVINNMLEDKDLALAGLERLKQVFEVFVQNKQPYPLYYERAWGGVVSSGSYKTGSDGIDFGNTYYNDHHFHYGYLVLTAAIIGYLDPDWLVDNRDYVDTLARDYGNPSTRDKYFPQYRCFDWFHGHSWAHGLYESLDGKDQESSSEDVMSAFALKMWGQVVGDANMAARGNLQLAVMARSLQNYYLLRSDNENHPRRFVGNKVAGILFENKCDHTTYFGPNIEYVQGIHMLPLLPASGLVRTRDFVREEWDTYFSDGRVDRVEGAWKGIIYGNLAILDPKATWKFFADTGFSGSWLDGGASLTWYLAYAAAMGGA